MDLGVIKLILPKKLVYFLKPVLIADNGDLRDIVVSDHVAPTPPIAVRKEKLTTLDAMISARGRCYAMRTSY